MDFGIRNLWVRTFAHEIHGLWGHAGRIADANVAGVQDQLPFGLGEVDVERRGLLVLLHQLVDRHHQPSDEGMEVGYVRAVDAGGIAERDVAGNRRIPLAPAVPHPVQKRKT